MTALRNELSDEELAKLADRGEPEKARWSQTEQLLAGISDRLARLEHVYRCAHAESKSKQPDPPEPIRRPGAKPPKRKATLTERSADTLFKLLNGGAA